MSLTNQWMKKTLLLSAVSFSFSSYSGPQLSTKCGIDVKNPKNGTGVSFEENCRTAYVLPPALGTMRLEALAPSMNLQFCRAMSQSGNIAEKYMKSLFTLAEKVDTLIQDAKPIERRQTELRELLATKEAAYNKAKSVFTQEETESQNLEAAKRKAALEYDDCVAQNPTAPDKCEATLSEKNATDKSYVRHRLVEYKQARRALDLAEYEQDEATRKLAAQSKRYQDALQPLVDLSNSIAELNNQVTQIYATYAAYEGATGAIVYETGWANLISEYQSLNKDLGIAFQQIPVKQGSLWGTLKASGDRTLAPQIPAVLSAVIPGYSDVKSTPEATGETVPVGKSTPSAPNASLMNASVQGLKGQIVLSLAGSCGLFEGPNAKPRDVNFDQITAHMVLNASYTYELAAHRGYTASYQLAEMMSRFEEYVQKGGFFSTSTVHSIIENNNSNTWFNIKFDAESSEFQYTPEEQEELKKTVKAELADQALKRVAMLNAGTAPALPPVGGQSGAGAISASLRYCPMWYCQAGSLVFGVLDSIFGRKSAISDFKRHNNVWVTDAVRGVRIVDRTQTLTFGLANPQFPEGARQ